MGTLIGLVTSQKKESNAPFAATAAENGLSVDPTTGRIVLGNNTGATSAVLLSNRVVPVSVAGGTSRSITLDDGNTGSSMVITNANFISITGGATSNFARLRLANQSGAVRMGMTQGTADFEFNRGVTNTRFARIDSTNGNMNYGAVPATAAFNSATFQVQGTFTCRQFLTNVTTGATSIDRDLDTSKLFHNTNATGAVTLNLPNFVGANDRPGFYCAAAIASANGITFQLSAGQTLFNGAAATTAGGTISSVTAGSFVRFALINSTTYVVESITGTWVLT